MKQTGKPLEHWHTNNRQVNLCSARLDMFASKSIYISLQHSSLVWEPTAICCFHGALFVSMELGVWSNVPSFTSLLLFIWDDVPALFDTIDIIIRCYWMDILLLSKVFNITCAFLQNEKFSVKDKEVRVFPILRHPIASQRYQSPWSCTVGQFRDISFLSVRFSLKIEWICSVCWSTFRFMYCTAYEKKQFFRTK